MKVELYVFIPLFIVIIICSIIYFVKYKIKKHLLNKRIDVDYTLIDKDGVIYFDNEETLTDKEFESKLISTYNADFDGDYIDIPSLLKLFAEECERKIIS